MPKEKSKVDPQVFPYPRYLPKGWSHIMHVLDLNEEETGTPSYGYNQDAWGDVLGESWHFIWDGTYNEEHWGYH